MNKFPALAPLFPGVHLKEITGYFESLPPPNETQCQSSDLNFEKLRGAYFLCFTNRCGSNYVAQAMSSGGDLAQAGESINFNTVINQSRRLGLSSFAEYFFWLVNALKGRAEIFGCKVSVEQLLILYNEGLLSRFAPVPKFIHVIRKDVLAQAVSLYIASKTNQWTSEQLASDVLIDYDRDVLISIVRSICFQNAAFESIFQFFGSSPLVVYYEDFVMSPHVWIKNIGDFVGVKDLLYVSEAMSYRKQADQRNESLILRLRQEFKL